jgi:phosphate transport system protein
MRDTFHKELETLDQDVVRMGTLVEQSTQMVTRALIEGDQVLAQRVRDGDDEIDDLFMSIERRALMLLAQQAPVAGDLRLIVAILRVVNDLERAGDLCHNIAKVVQVERFDGPGLKPVKALVAQLGESAAALVGRAVDSWAAKDEQRAAELAGQDDEIDDLHEALLEQLVDLKGQRSLGPALRLALVGRYLERIGDHAVNMGERVRYYVTGDEEHLG